MGESIAGTVMGPCLKAETQGCPGPCTANTIACSFSHVFRERLDQTPGRGLAASTGDALPAASQQRIVRKKAVPKAGGSGEKTAAGQGQALAPAGSPASCCGWHKHCLTKCMLFSFGFLLVIWLY